MTFFVNLSDVKLVLRILKNSSNLEEIKSTLSNELTNIFLKTIVKSIKSDKMLKEIVNTTMIEETKKLNDSFKKDLAEHQCPLTKRVFYNPVFFASERGQCFEKKVLEKLLKKNGFIHPISAKKLSANERNILPDESMKHSVASFREKFFESATQILTIYLDHENTLKKNDVDGRLVTLVESLFRCGEKLRLFNLTFLDQEEKFYRKSSAKVLQVRKKKFVYLFGHKGKKGGDVHAILEFYKKKVYPLVKNNLKEKLLFYDGMLKYSNNSLVILKEYIAFCSENSLVTTGVEVLSKYKHKLTLSLLLTYLDFLHKRVSELKGNKEENFIRVFEEDGILNLPLLKNNSKNTLTVLKNCLSYFPQSKFFIEKIFISESESVEKKSQVKKKPVKKPLEKVEVIVTEKKKDIVDDGVVFAKIKDCIRVLNESKEDHLKITNEMLVERYELDTLVQKAYEEMEVQDSLFEKLENFKYRLMKQNEEDERERRRKMMIIRSKKKKKKKIVKRIPKLKPIITKPIVKNYNYVDPIDRPPKEKISSVKNFEVRKFLEKELFSDDVNDDDDLFGEKKIFLPPREEKKKIVKTFSKKNEKKPKISISENDELDLFKSVSRDSFEKQVLYVKGMVDAVTRMDFIDYFAEYGAIKEFVLVEGKNYALIEYEKKDVVKKVMREREHEINFHALKLDLIEPAQMKEIQKVEYMSLSKKLEVAVTPFDEKRISLIELKNHFCSCGRVKKVHMSKIGYALVEFETVRALEMALLEKHGTKLNGVILNVSLPGSKLGKRIKKATMKKKESEKKVKKKNYIDSENSENSENSDDDGDSEEEEEGEEEVEIKYDVGTNVLMCGLSEEAYNQAVIKDYFAGLVARNSVRSIKFIENTYDCMVEFGTRAHIEKAMILDNEDYKINNCVVDLYMQPKDKDYGRKKKNIVFVDGIGFKTSKKAIKRFFSDCGIIFDIKFNKRLTILEFNTSKAKKKALKKNGEKLERNRIKVWVKK